MSEKLQYQHLHASFKYSMCVCLCLCNMHVFFVCWSRFIISVGLKAESNVGLPMQRTSLSRTRILQRCISTMTFKSRCCCCSENGIKINTEYWSGCMCVGVIVFLELWIFWECEMHFEKLSSRADDGFLLSRWERQCPLPIERKSIWRTIVWNGWWACVCWSASCRVWSGTDRRHGCEHEPIERGNTSSHYSKSEWGVRF